MFDLNFCGVACKCCNLVALLQGLRNKMLPGFAGCSENDKLHGELVCEKLGRIFLGVCQSGDAFALCTLWAVCLCPLCPLCPEFLVTKNTKFSQRTQRLNT